MYVETGLIPVNMPNEFNVFVSVCLSVLFFKNREDDEPNDEYRHEPGRHIAGCRLLPVRPRLPAARGAKRAVNVLSGEYTG